MTKQEMATAMWSRVPIMAAEKKKLKMMSKENKMSYQHASNMFKTS